MDEKGMELLAYAIVRRAAADYRLALDGRLPAKWNAQEIENFFLGSFFEVLMPHVDGQAILTQLKENYVLHGVTIFDSEAL